jgi:spore coat polysaccharide biosynthesis protein SpsF
MNQNNKIVAIIQARMTSSRLPGKVLKEIAGIPMIAHVINRVAKAKLVDQTIIATTHDPADNLIEEFCNERGIACFRGHPFDVLDRYYQAALKFQANTIVRITADCPLIDAELIDQIILSFLEMEVDFAANRLPPPWKRSFPIGLDIEVVRFTALEKAWKSAVLPFEREHVLPYLYDQPDRFKILLMHHEPDYGIKRWTVDTSQDLDLVEKIFHHFSPQIDFSWLEVIKFFEENPELETINTDISAKNVNDVDGRFVDQKR